MVNSARKRAIAGQIRKTFLSNAYRMKIYPAHHFATRVYRITGDTDVKPTVLANLLKNKTRVLNDIMNAHKKGYVRKRSAEIYKERKKRKGRKERMRQRFFRTRKEYLFYYNLIENLYFWRCFGISKGRFRTHYQKGLSILRRERARITRYILDKGAVRYFGTQTVNYVYFLKFFGVCDIRARFRKAWQDIFMETNDLSDYAFKNKIYGMTHFIIAGSDYYQKTASKKEFGWILDYFQQNADSIIRRTHIDIIAEVGLCLRLCGIKSGKALDAFSGHVAGCFDPKIGFVPRKGYVPRKKERDINVAEHTNAISFMLLRGFTRLYPGPDLSKEFDKEIALGEAP